MVLPVTGVTVGAVQMVRGVVNTREAMVEAHKGKIWDEVRRSCAQSQGLQGPLGPRAGRGGQRAARLLTRTLGAW